jgi:Ca2+-binding RTX toxin-like protein
VVACRVPGVLLGYLGGYMAFLTSRALLTAALMGPALALLAQAPASARPSCAGHAATIVGTNGEDYLRGTSHRDVIVARGGDDTVNGLGGHDIICGGAGNDDLNGGGGRDRIFGGSGADWILGDDGADRLFGGFSPHSPNGRHDHIGGGRGNDLLRGGSGADTLSGDAGDDRLFGGDDADWLDGGPGADLLDSGDNTTYNRDYGIEDRLEVDAGADRLVGRNPHVEAWLGNAPRGIRIDLEAGTVRGWGRDTVTGVSRVHGSNYGDRIMGTSAAETFMGDRGADVILGRGGDDLLFGDQGADVVRGQGGNDIVRASGSKSRAYGGRGADEVRVIYGAYADGQWGDDQLVPLGRSRVEGGPGRDELALYNLWRGVHVDLATGVVSFGKHEIQVAGVEDVAGTNYDDVLRGDSGDNFLDGWGGDDQLFGRDGDDTLQGYFGNDVVDGAAGTDLCAGETVTSCEGETSDHL